MKEESELKIKQLNFRISSMGRNGIRSVSMEDIPSREIVVQMLKQLTFEDAIYFWDYYHVTVTDPGGYVTAYMLDEDRAVYMEGNHGWTSRYEAISVDYLAEMIIKNWDKDCDGGMYMNAIQVGPHYSIEKHGFLYDL